MKYEDPKNVDLDALPEIAVRKKGGFLLVWIGCFFGRNDLSTVLWMLVLWMLHGEADSTTCLLDWILMK